MATYSSFACKRALVVQNATATPAPLFFFCYLGDHTAAAASSERAQTIAAKNRRHADAVNHLLPTTTTLAARKTVDLSDPLPRLEWMGVQRFAAGDDPSARDFFAQARKLVLLRVQEQASSNSKHRTDVNGRRSFDYCTAGARVRGAALTGGASSPRKITSAPKKEPVEGARHDAEITTGEFHPDAMRLDRCVAVSICRQGPEAF